VAASTVAVAGSDSGPSFPPATRSSKERGWGQVAAKAGHSGTEIGLRLFDFPDAAALGLREHCAGPELPSSVTAFLGAAEHHDAAAASGSMGW
jgi:hypothetical protein